MNVVSNARPTKVARWWREPMMWLVVGAPAMAVVGGVAILVIALRVPDPVMRTDAPRPAATARGPVAADKALLPALVGRNHAATPDVDVPARGR